MTPDHLCLIFHFSQNCKSAMKNSAWHSAVTGQTEAMRHGPLGPSISVKNLTTHYYDTDTTNHWLFIIHGFVETNIAWLVVIVQKNHWHFSTYTAQQCTQLPPFTPIKPQCLSSHIMETHFASQHCASLFLSLVYPTFLLFLSIPLSGSDQ